MPQKIRTLRRKKAIKQEDLANTVGISVAALSRIENGHSVPRPDTLRKLALALGVLPEDISI